MADFAGESLVGHPEPMNRASVAGTDLEMSADLVRLSLGIGTADDLIADLDRELL
jgi:cystathionine gamma-synthase